MEGIQVKSLEERSDSLLTPLPYGIGRQTYGFMNADEMLVGQGTGRQLIYLPLTSWHAWSTVLTA